MFILRRITSDHTEINVCLGESYNLIDAERNKNEFERTVKIMKWNDVNLDDIYGFIVYSNGSKIETLYKKSVYFVMLSNGQTFANITFK